MIKIQVDSNELARLNSEMLRQMPFAANNAITRTAKEAAEAAQNEARTKLQIRKEFLLRRIRILHYSRANNLTAVIGVDENVQGSPLIIGFLEEGQAGEKTGSLGSGVAVPLTGSATRPSFAQSVTKLLFYKRLQMQKHTTEHGAIQWKGRQRTFVIPGIGIFQRIGAKKGRRRGKGFVGRGGAQLDASTSTALLYRFMPAAHLGTHVQLRRAMIDVIEKRFRPIFNEEFAKEIIARAQHLANK